MDQETDNIKLAVVCFYWIGDRWSDDGLGAVYINRLFSGVKRYLTIPHRFICFTNERIDLDKGIIKRRFDMPSGRGVLPRLFMYSRESGLFGHQVLALDLDIIIVGNLDDIGLYDGVFCSRSKFKPGEEYKLDGDVTSFQAGELNEARFWKPFRDDPKKVIDITDGRERYWYRHVIGETGGDRWDKICPGQVVSYKRHIKTKGGRIPAGARIVSCHGRPRPHEIQKEWAKKAWA